MIGLAHYFKNKTILVQGAGGVVGHFAVQFATVSGCYFIASVGSEKRGNDAKSAGAKYVFNRHDNNFVNKMIANTASLQKNILLLKKGENFNPQVTKRFFESFSIQLENNFNTFNLTSENPENMNLFDLYNYILLMKKLGVNYSNHLPHLLKELLQPILMISLILICAPLIL